MSEYTLIKPSEVDFFRAERFKKITVLPENNIEIAKDLEFVETIIDGKKEGDNWADIGDYIITGSKGERYVLKPEDFRKNWKRDNVNPTFFRSRRVVRAIRLLENTQIMAPWGELQQTEAGGYIARDENDHGNIYLIHKGAFRMDYERLPSILERAASLLAPAERRR